MPDRHRDFERAQTESTIEWLTERAEINRVEREAQLLNALSALVRAHDAPPDGTGFARDRAAIVEARKLLGMAPVYGVDGEPA